MTMVWIKLLKEALKEQKLQKVFHDEKTKDLN
jgi:hypothetical protein